MTATAAPPDQIKCEVVEDDHAKLPLWFKKAGKGKWNAIPDAVWEKLCDVFPMTTIQVYCAIAKETWGTTMRQRGPDGKLIRDEDGSVVLLRREWCEEPQEAISRRLNAGLSTVAEAIADLVRCKLTIREPLPSDRRRARYKHDLDALLAFDPDSFEDDEDVMAQEANDEDVMAQEAKEQPTEASIAAPAQSASPLRAVQPHEPLILLPGERNRPFVLGEQRYKLRNDGPSQVAVNFSLLDDGDVEVAIRPVSDVQEKPESEKKANPIGAQQVTEKIHPENRMYSGQTPAAACSGGGERHTAETAAARETTRQWIDVERDPAFARFTAVISTLSTRLQAPPPALPWRRQQFERLTEAGVPIEAFEARFKLRGAALTSYQGVPYLITDVIDAAREAAAARPATVQADDTRQFDEFDYEAHKAQALDAAMQNLEPDEHEALKQACVKELSASDPKWGLLTRDQRWMRVDAAIRAKIRDQLKLPTFREFIAARRSEAARQ